MYIKLDDIIPNRFQPREVFDEEALNKLADSIRLHGVIEPILVRPVSNKYEIVAGERRYKASVLAGLTKIPAMVRKLDDKESSIVAFIENEHRSDVSAIEEARTMDRILKNNNMTQEELAKELGVNQSTVANKLRLLNLPIEVQDSLMKNEISERHARSLLSVKDELKQIELLNKIKEKKMSVRELDSEIKNMNDGMNNFNEQTNGFIGQFPGESNITPNMGVEPPKEAFNPNDYMNNFGSTPTVEKPVETNPTSTTTPMDDNAFMSFLDSFNKNHTSPFPQNEPFNLKEQTPTATPEGNDFRNILNSYDNPPTPPQNENVNNGVSDDTFMNFLNDFDKQNPLPSEPASEPPKEVANEPAEDPGFMSFLNNYDTKFPLPEEEAPASENPTEPAAPVEPTTPSEPSAPADGGFMNFLNSYENNPEPKVEVTTPPEPVVDVKPEESFNYNLPPIDNNLYDGFSSAPKEEPPTPPSPPVTNQYIEDTANFVDVSKQDKITSVDAIIDKLGTVVKEIKEKSVFKVDTEEINYDDIYQITIKIDKRDF